MLIEEGVEVDMRDLRDSFIGFPQYGIHTLELDIH